MKDIPVIQPICSYEQCQRPVAVTCEQCGKRYCAHHSRLIAPRRYQCSNCLGKPALAQPVAPTAVPVQSSHEGKPPTDMAFDLSGAVQQARTGTIPANWRRYPLRFVRNTIGISLIVGILCIVGAIFIWVTGSIPLISVVLVALRVDPSIISLISGLIVLAVGIFGLVTGLVFAIRFHRLWDRDRYFFLVTPEGFAEVKGEKVVGLAFAEVADLKERNGSLVVRKRTGEYMTLEIRWSYWPRKITKTLLKKLAAQRQAQG